MYMNTDPRDGYCLMGFVCVCVCVLEGGVQILNAVDNYAVLYLDIVWCYLCLQNVNYPSEGQ